jgi:hypothetical protein
LALITIRSIVTHGLWTDVRSKLYPKQNTTVTDEGVGVAGDDTTHHHHGKRKYSYSSLIHVNSATFAADDDDDDDDDWNANNTTFPPTAALSVGEQQFPSKHNQSQSD